MTISSVQQKIIYVGTGVTTSFAIPFQMGNLSPLANFIQVWLRDELASPATETLQVSTVDYNIVATNVVMVAAPLVTQKLVLKRVVPLTQVLSYLQNVNFPIADHEGAIDRLTLISQYLYEVITRSAKLPNTTGIADLALPEPDPGLLLAWNAGATGLMNVSPANLGFLTALLAQDSQALANNQGAQANITNMSFDGSVITSVEVHYEIARTSSLNDIFTNGILYLRYRSGAWEVEDGLIVGDLSGITFSIVSAGSVGQVKYTSSNITGTGYAGNIKWRTITFS